MGRLTITQISHPDRQYDAIWVLNNLRGEERGALGINVKDGNDNWLMMQIPATYLPTNLIERAPRDSILKSQDFRDVVNSGHIIIIDEEEAESILGTDGVDDEINRIRDLNELTNKELANKFSIDKPSPVTKASDAAEIAAAKARGKSAIRSKVETILQSIDTEGEVRIVNRLRSYAPDLDNDDWQFVKGIAVSGRYAKIVDYAENNIQ